MSRSTELLAIFKLEFYKKKKNWVIGVEKKQRTKQKSNRRNSLDETYIVNAGSAGPSMLNDAFMESATVPDETEPVGDKPLQNQNILNNNCQDLEQCPNLNLTQNLQYSKLDNNPHLSKATVKLAKLQNILLNDTPALDLDDNMLKSNVSVRCGAIFPYNHDEDQILECGVTVDDKPRYPFNFDDDQVVNVGDGRPMHPYKNADDEVLGVNPMYPYNGSEVQILDLAEANVDGATWPMFPFNYKDDQVLDSSGANVGACGPMFTQVGQTGIDRNVANLQGWPRKSAMWTNVNYKVSNCNDREFVSEQRDAPDGHLPPGAHQVFATNHPESEMYQAAGPPFSNDLLRRHLENLRIQEWRYDQGDVGTAPPRSSHRSLEAGLGDSLESLDCELFMLGAHRAPHSSEIELTVPRVFHKPRSTVRQPDYRRPMRQDRSLDVSQSLTRSPSFEDYPTRDIDPPRHQDYIVASSFKNLTDFDRYFVGRGRGRLPNRGASGVGGWKC